MNNSARLRSVSATSLLQEIRELKPSVDQERDLVINTSSVRGFWIRKRQEDGFGLWSELCGVFCLLGTKLQAFRAERTRRNRWKKTIDKGPLEVTRPGEW